MNDREMLVAVHRELATLSTIIHHAIARLDTVEKKVDALTESVTRYRGITRGVMWVSTALWSVFLAFKSNLAIRLF